MCDREKNTRTSTNGQDIKVYTVQLGYCDSDVTVCLLFLEYAYCSRRGCKVSI